MASPASPVTIIVNSLHEGIDALAGWSVYSDDDGLILEFRKGAVDGDLLGVVAIRDHTNDQTDVFERSISVDGGVYVKLVEGSMGAGVLYSG